MKKILYISLSTLLSLNLFANNNLSLKKIPLDNKFLSSENGGEKSAIDAYSDGVGIYTVGLSDKKFAAMNELVFVHGEEAKKSGETLKEFVLDNGNIKEKELASYLGPFTSYASVIGEDCDDGNPYTEKDEYIDTNGTCQGTEVVVRSENKCEGDLIGSEFLVDGISYLVVDDDSIRDNLDRAETLCTSNVTDMSYLFADKPEWGNYFGTFNGDISSWDTSNVIYMYYLFTFNKEFNGDISSWDTSNVVDMEGIFGLSNFNMDISNWDTSKVINMSYMFYENKLFNKPLNNLNTSKVLTFENMFNGASLFNQPLNNWNVSFAVNMEGMFFQAESFNQPLNKWNTSNATNMFAMFYEAYNFNQDINSWNVYNVLNYSYFSSGSGLDYSYSPLFN